MGTVEHFFSDIAARIGYGRIAKRAGVSYQAVSRFANDPKPTHKYRLRGRVLDATIDEVVNRRSVLEKELSEIDGQIAQLKTWKENEFQ